MLVRRLVTSTSILSRASPLSIACVKKYSSAPGSSSGDQPQKPSNTIFPTDFLNTPRRTPQQTQNTYELSDNSQADFASHVLNVQATASNTILSFSTVSGDVLVSASCGTAGFKKARRAGFESAYQATVQLVEKVKRKNISVSDLHLKFKGFGLGREAAFRAIRSNTDWNISRITDVTPVPHNGCRPPKPRRL
jgi:small subunit ribosomal protein S11